MVVGEAGARLVEKRLLARFRGDAVARRQLQVEARVLELLRGRGAPRFVSAGEDGQGPWLRMDYLAMPSLAGEGARPGLVAAIGRGAFQALARVHEADDASGSLEVVHGDVSPDNLLVDAASLEARLVDFGLASYRDAPASPSGVLRGTPRYMAPEVARGEPATAKSDRFSLALTLLHAASGTVARPHASLAAVVVAAGQDPVDAYAARASLGLPAPLREALVAAVAFRPDDRPASARAATPAAW